MYFFKNAVFLKGGRGILEFYESKTIEQLTATLAHEVKNPVSLIRANIDYMSLNDKDNMFSENFELIKRELNKISNIVMDFINFIKPNADYEKEIIFIVDLIREVIEEFNIPFKHKNIKFDIIVESDDIKLIGEYSKLYIAFFNILKNAVEAVKENGNIDTSVNCNENDVIIKITDSGEGFCGNNPNKLIEPFFTTKTDGSGLGLPICKSIIDYHGGSFCIYENKGGGCCVEIVLPLKKE